MRKAAWIGVVSGLFIFIVGSIFWDGTGTAQEKPVQTILNIEPATPIDKIPAVPITVTGESTVTGQATVTGAATVTGDATVTITSTIGDLERQLQQSYKNYLTQNGWVENPDNPPGFGKWFWEKELTYQSTDGTTKTRIYRMDLMNAVDSQIGLDVQAATGKVPQ